MNATKHNDNLKAPLQVNVQPSTVPYVEIPNPDTARCVNEMYPTLNFFDVKTMLDDYKKSWATKMLEHKQRKEGLL